MSTRRVTTCSNKELLWALMVLTVAFLCFEVSYLFQYLHAFLFAFDFTTHDLALPLSVWPPICLFILIQLMIHLLFTLCVWVLTINLGQTFPPLRPRLLETGITVWIMAIITVHCANMLYFPNSKYSLLLSHFIPQALARYCFYALLIVWLAIFAVTLFVVLKKLKQKPVISTLLTVFFAANIYLFHSHTTPPTTIHDAATRDKPNIIIIGIDSLRPDFLSYFGSEHTTPFFDAFLEQATVFSDAVTPTGRTYPSWVSILTGKHPVLTGARSNLANEGDIHFIQSLPKILSNVGYQTVYATDETRFNNIDEHYDFDHAITPPIGVTEFIIGSSNDFPLSNLLVNTRLGKWLFPYNYGNRPSFFNYNPDSFLQLINDNIQADRQQSLFLAIHFCLPHHPYLWGGFNTANTTSREWYRASIARVDQQLNDFFAILNNKKLLDHAIVILLSDHGETLEMPGDRITEADLYIKSGKEVSFPRFYPPSKDEEPVNMAGGHGTDVLGLPQYHSLLAFRLYGTGFQQIGVIPGVVSLMDIKPTILDIIKVKLKSALRDSEGRSLAGIVADKSEPAPLRHIFIESNFSPVAIRTTYPDMAETLLEGIKIFEINPASARLTVKSSMRDMIIASKQFADIYDHWMLALYPQKDNTRMPILVDLKSGQWTNNLDSQFARQSPAKEMKQRLESFYFSHRYSQIQHV